MDKTPWDVGLPPQSRWEPPAASEELHDRVHRAVGNVSGICADYTAYAGMAQGELLALVSAVRRLKEEVATLMDYVEAEVIQGWGPDPKAKVETLLGTWEVKKGSTRKWPDPEMLMMDLTAESDPPAASLVHAIAQCLPANVAWRVTALRERGLDPDDYSEWEGGRRRLVFIPKEDVDE